MTIIVTNTAQLGTNTQSEKIPTFVVFPFWWYVIGEMQLQGKFLDETISNKYLDKNH